MGGVDLPAQTETWPLQAGLVPYKDGVPSRSLKSGELCGDGMSNKSFYRSPPIIQFCFPWF